MLKYFIYLTILLLPSYLIRFSLFKIPLTLLEILVFITFLIWLIQIIQKKQTINPKILDYKWPIGLFLLAGIISIFVSPNIISALGQFKAYILEPILFFVVLASVIKKEQIKEIFFLLGVEVIFIFVYAALQYLGVLTSPLPWVAETPKRVTSIFDYPNAVGLLVAPIISLFIALLTLLSYNSINLLSKIIFPATVIITGLLATFFASTQGAYLGIAAALIFLAFFMKNKKIILAIIVILIIITLLLPQSRTFLIANINLNHPAISSRLIIWQIAITALSPQPLLGLGLAGFNPAYEQINSKLTEHFIYPHNIVLNFWSELGLLGLIAFIWLTIKFFKSGFKDLDSHKIALMCFMVCLIVYGLVDVPYFKNDLSLLFWTIIGLIIL